MSGTCARGPGRSAHSATPSMARFGARNGRRRWSSGMTLIEVMIVIVILALISTAVAINAVQHADKARISRARMDLGSIEQALEFYRARRGHYPDPGPGLEGLRKELGLKDIVDPWGRTYLYELRDGEPRVFTLSADGEVGGDGVNADLSNQDPPNPGG